jgi:outer membrane lipoprotein-sorting protein
LRVLHVSRADLQPYRQDLYNAEGKVITQATYSDYKKFGDISFPTKIVIQRPLDELGLTVTITKATFNQKLDADQFDSGPIPASFKHQNMDDPVSAAANPCASHEPQSTH